MAFWIAEIRILWDVNVTNGQQFELYIILITISRTKWVISRVHEWHVSLVGFTNHFIVF